MHRKKISVAIPYKQRARNLRIMLECLSNQKDFPLSDLEVVVGAMEISDEYLDICRAFPQLDIVSVMTGRDFEIPVARNLAIRQCTGEVTLHVDADTALAPNALARLYDRHFRFGQNVCVVGQMIGYGNNAGDDIKEIAALTYDGIADTLRMFENSEPKDNRFTVPHLIPWAFTWTGLVAVPTDYAVRENLIFDESFKGWGIDDLEWGFRVSRSGLPIVLDSSVASMNLPHIRHTTDNRKTEARNYRRFLEKWPCLEVELSSAIGDVEANLRYGYFASEMSQTFGDSRGARIISLSFGDRAALIIGVDQTDCHAFAAQTDAHWDMDVIELSGLSIPFDATHFETAFVSQKIARMPRDISGLIMQEATRVAKEVKSFDEVGELPKRLKAEL